LQKIVASFFIFIASISYGFLSIIAKFAYEDGVNPAMLAVSQMFFGVLFFALIKFKHIPTFFKIDKKSLSILFLGGTMSALTALFYYTALKSLSASLGIILLFQFVWIGVVLELIFEKRKPNLHEIFSVLLCYMGTYLSVAVGTEFSMLSIGGVILGFLAAAAFAGYIFITSAFCLAYDANTRAFWTIAFAFLSTLALGIFFMDFDYGFAVFGWGAACGFFGVALPFYLYAVFANKIGSAATSIIGSVELPTVLVLSAIFLNEKLSVYGIIGSSLVILAAVAVFLGATKAK
jgi:drug/metabolite transporter (DMT)-like permease